MTGVQRGTFEKIVSVLLEAQQRRYRKNGRKGNLSIEDKLLMALEYLRQYRTYFYFGNSYCLSQSACYHAYRWVEDVLIKSGAFSLPGKKELFKSDMEYEVILIDAKKSPIERPKKSQKEKRVMNHSNRQKHFYSGKKKRHILKSQVVVEKKSIQKSKEEIWFAI